MAETEAHSRGVALITGGVRGIGLETARQLGRLGFTVVLGARDGRKGDEAARKLLSEDIAAEAIQCDVKLQADREATYAHLQARYGKLDVLINNAGVWLESDSASDESPNRTSSVPPEVLRETFEVNFFAPVMLTQRLLPLMRRASAARIVNVSSIHGSLTLHSDPSSVIYPYKYFAYGASKSALNAFTVQLAYELRDTQIKVNAAHPGWVRTEMGGRNAMLDVSEGSRTSVQLATLPPEGPSGGFFYLGEVLPW